MFMQLPSADGRGFVDLTSPPQIEPSTEKMSSRAIDDFDSGHNSTENHVLDVNIPSCRSEADNFPDLEEMPLNLFPATSVDGIYQYLTEAAGVFPVTDRNNTALHSTNTDDEHSALIRSNDNSLPITRPLRGKGSKSSIVLSSRVAITDANSRAIQLVHPIESTYRPRYKSDYFPQNGIVRHPRYIADSEDNHFITLKLPSAYHHDLADKCIRVALITVCIDGHKRYYSPYKFQTDHNDAKVADENPTYIEVDTSDEHNYTMKLHLVLIKSKLDQLHSVQPLEPFDTTIDVRKTTHKRVSPKELINRYQLDKAHLAFTLCTKLPDGTYQLHPDTTTISSVFSEASSAKKANETSVNNAQPAVHPLRHLCCPNCAHRFGSDASSSSTESRQCSSSPTTTSTANKHKRQKTT